MPPRSSLPSSPGRAALWLRWPWPLLRPISRSPACPWRPLRCRGQRTGHNRHQSRPRRGPQERGGRNPARALPHLGAHMRQQLEKALGSPIADDAIDLASPQHQDRGWKHVDLAREARALVARGGNIDEADRQLSRQGLLVARQHIAAKKLAIDAVAMLINQELDVWSAHAGRRVEGGAPSGAAG